jgi:hypothetical protein
MKQLTVIKITIFLVITFLAIGCKPNSPDNLKDDQSEILKAEAELKTANEEFRIDLENYRIEIENKISANERAIEDFKISAAYNEKEDKSGYNKRIDEIEMKNMEMKRKLAEFKQDGSDKWKSFKTEFSRDMDELGKALKDLTVNNVN